MSTESWIGEFYPVTAEVMAAREGVKQSQLVEHCLLKWHGLTKDNLQVHEIEGVDGQLFLRLVGSLTENRQTCSLCVYDNIGAGNCTGCVLREYHIPTSNEPFEAGDPCVVEWNAWCHEEGPLPMIELLENVLDDLLRKGR